MDIFQVVRFLLDRLGFDLFEMPEIRLYDVRHRSFVRCVGTHLPLSAAKRAKFQTHFLTSNSSGKETVLDCANFGDVGSLEEASFVSGITMRSDMRRTTSMGPRISTPDTSAICRISELEDELAKLRQQIATIVLMQEQSLSLEGDCAPGGPQPGAMAMPKTPVLQTPTTPPSTPVPPPCVIPPPPPCPPGAGPPPPPPPPCAPPPPPPPPIQTPKRSAIDLIKENRAKAKDKVKPTGQLDMSEVLKGIGKVRLRAVERSPGGTPIRRTAKPQSPVDPASLIAHALKKKFAHRRLYSPDGKRFSPDKENLSPRTSPLIVAPSLMKPSQMRNLKAKRRSSPLAADWE